MLSRKMCTNLCEFMQFKSIQTHFLFTNFSSKMATYDEVKDIPNHPESYLIDVRNKDEIANTGEIPSSINIPLPELENALKMSEDDFHNKFNRPKPKKESPLIFSCLLGGRAQRATDLALTLGFKNSKTYKGSWTEWASKEGL